jgi:Kef-type K+ transport system membrane component KefB
VRSVLLYALILAAFVAAIVLVLHYGAGLPPAGGTAQPGSGTAAINVATLRVLLLQIVATLVAAYAMSWVARWFGQPAVVGEIAGGIVLGPTMVGYFWPATFHALFPAGSLGALKLLAEVGIILFMFRVGLDVDLGVLRHSTRRAVLISHFSIAVPFLLGVLISVALYRSFAPAGTSFVAFALFTGIAMAITAFPVLARILTDRGMATTPLGSMALTCAAVDDITAWSLLAMVVAVVKGQSRADAAMIIVWSVLFAVAMVRLVRPLLLRVGVTDVRLVILMFGAAALTEAIGIHAVFGSFLAGVIVPLTPERRREYVERFSIVTPALLPLFFAYIGVRTQITLLHDTTSLGACIAVILVATLGKLGGSAIGARITGMPWRDALAIGALMNTRGLMELIALNIGYDLGILTPSIFAILVVMALVTTIGTGPLLRLFMGTKGEQAA